MSLPIAVIESRWDAGWGITNNLSVRPFFQLLGSINDANPENFHYEMFSSKSAFQEIMKRLGTDPRFKYAYIACHGDEKGLYPHNGELISRSVLRHSLKDSLFQGVYLATCGFCQIDLAKFLFEESQRLVWVSGYTEEYIGWAESSPIDMIFLNHLIAHDQQDAEPRKAIGDIASQLRNDALGLCARLGFSMYVKEDDLGVVDILGARNFGMASDDRKIGIGRHLRSVRR